MRTIKFRAKYKGDWVYGSLLNNTISTDNIRCTIVEADAIYHINVKPETIGQFTCLRDCEGTEIYEGDIVMVENTLACEISWNNSIAAYCLMRNGEMYHGVFPIYPKLIRLIGNIHDNPELIQ
jgi:YopX protein